MALLKLYCLSHIPKLQTSVFALQRSLWAQKEVRLQTAARKLQIRLMKKMLVAV
jgi:hypothetical protein